MNKFIKYSINAVLDDSKISRNYHFVPNYHIIQLNISQRKIIKNSDDIVKRFKKFREISVCKGQEQKIFHFEIKIIAEII